MRRDRGGAGDGRPRRAVVSVVSSQVDLHAQFGGVVPEIASRAHLDLLNPVIARAIVEAGVETSAIDAVACTVGPGLIGALLVGVSAAKALALAWDVPFVGVNHLEAHLYAAFLEDPTLELPLVVLLVSGGHTMLIEMRGHGQLPAARPDDRRRRRRGVRQGRPLPRPRLPGRAGDRPRGRARRPDGDRLPPGDAQRRARLLLQRAEDVGASTTSASTPTSRRPTWPRRSRRRSSTCSWPRPGGPRPRSGAKGLVLGGGVAANSLLRERFLDACVRGRPPRLPAQPGDVHRQRGDDRRRRLAPPPQRRPHPARRRRRNPTCACTLRSVDCRRPVPVDRETRAVASSAGGMPWSRTVSDRAHALDRPRGAGGAGADGRRHQRAVPRAVPAVRARAGLRQRDGDGHGAGARQRQDRADDDVRPPTSSRAACSSTAPTRRCSARRSARCATRIASTTSTSTSAARPRRSPARAAGPRCRPSRNLLRGDPPRARSRPRRRTACRSPPSSAWACTTTLLTLLDTGRIAADEGVAAIALHARTAEQHYAGRRRLGRDRRAEGRRPGDPGARQRRHLGGRRRAWR